MRCIQVHNVNQALSEGLLHILHFGQPSPSRGGEVLVAPTPVITTYDDPTARVLFSPLRDANPYFHLMEAIWMLAGDNDLEWPAYFAKRMRQFSDDGNTLHGAYGYRWRRHYKLDQLPIIAEELCRNPESRRAVLAMWDPSAEHSAMAFGDAKDIPCNTHIYFRVQNGKLEMTVLCRSNDILWGAYGANAVHMSFLQEYMAALVGVDVGVYRQFSNNFHLYTDIVKRGDIEKLADDARQTDRYTYSLGPHQTRPPLPFEDQPVRVPLVQNLFSFNEDLRSFMVDPEGPCLSTFFLHVAKPMYRSWKAHKEKDHAAAFSHAMSIKAEDWKIACTEWLRRREDNRAAKAHRQAVEDGQNA